jgi:hypothetical protein
VGESHEHHYLPQLLLREFGHGGARQWLWVYDKTTDNVFRGSVKKSAKRYDYNATARADGTTDDELERIFGSLETGGAPALARLRGLGVGLNGLDPLDRSNIAVFMAAQHLRVPAIRGAAESAAKLWAAMQIDRGLSGDPEMLAEWRRGDLEAVPPAGLVQLELLSTGLDKLAERFFDMNWRVLQRGRPPWLVLGDAPVSPLRPPGIADDDWKGFAHPDVDIALPISPGRLLLINGTRRDDTIAVIDDEIALGPGRHWVQEANQATWTRAARYIYGRSQADLEAARLPLDPAQRQAVRRPKVKNLAPEIEVHARDFEILGANPDGPGRPPG